MSKRRREGILPFKVVAANESLIARGGLVLPYELARVLKLPKVIDAELPPPGSGKGYKPSQFVIPLVLRYTRSVKFGDSLKLYRRLETG
jgi:hypothetical protein